MTGEPAKLLKFQLGQAGPRTYGRRIRIDAYHLQMALAHASN